MVIDSQPDLEVVGEAANGREAIDAARRLAPDVVLMDVRMPECDGVQATRTIVDSGSASRIIILTTFDLDEYVYAALRAGASGFLLKDAPAGRTARRDPRGRDRRRRRRRRASLAGCCRQYAHGCPPAGVPGAARARELLTQLTAREREVLLEVARSLNNAEIAEQLVLSEATVKTHVGRILSKLELRDRVQIVVLRLRDRADLTLPRPLRPSTGPLARTHGHAGTAHAVLMTR